MVIVDEDGDRIEVTARILCQRISITVQDCDEPENMPCVALTRLEARRLRTALNFALAELEND